MSILGRLNPKTSRLEPSSHGHMGGLSQTDVAAALAGVKVPLGNLLLRFKDAGDNSAGHQLQMQWREVVQNRATGKGWRAKDQGRFEKLADGTLGELLCERHTCDKCDGIGMIRPRKGNAKICEKCDGAGKIHPGVMDRARALGVHHSVFLRKWEDRWDELSRELGELEGMARMQLRNQLREPESAR